MWPNGEEDETFQERLRQLSTRKLVAAFLNGREIEVEYKYDRERLLEDRVEVNLRSVLPILGEVELPDGNEFVNTLTMKEFLSKNVKLHKCEQGIHSFCRNVGVDPDEYVDDYLEEDVCPQRHFHHYCPNHINRWFREYLSLVIALQNGRQDFADMIEFIYGEIGCEIAVNLRDILTPLRLWLWFVGTRKWCSVSD